MPWKRSNSSHPFVYILYTPHRTHIRPSQTCASLRLRPPTPVSHSHPCPFHANTHISHTMAKMEDENQHQTSVEIEHQQTELYYNTCIKYTYAMLPFSFQSGSSGVATGTRFGGFYVFTIVNIVGGRVCSVDGCNRRKYILTVYRELLSFAMHYFY